MRRSGTFELRLHPGRAPSWLVSRMKPLSQAIMTAIWMDKGPDEIIRRLSDPVWFQALSNVLGYDWDSSGSTTVTSSVVKDVLNGMEVGVRGAGGKGRRSRFAPAEIEETCELPAFSRADPAKLTYASRMAAKVDTCAIQAGYQIYHHVFYFTQSGSWTVVQQGMNPKLKSARRYHWTDENLKSFVVEPHTGIVGDVVLDSVLDMTAHESDDARKVSVDLVAESPLSLKRHLTTVRAQHQNSLTDWLPLQGDDARRFFKVAVESRVNWEALAAAYELKPGDYEQLLHVKGMGPGTVRALAMVAEVVYDAKVGRRDPVKYSFSFGGKDGIPYPVNRRRMDEVTTMLMDALDRARIGDAERLKAIRRLTSLTRSMSLKESGVGSDAHGGTVTAGRHSL
jgi:hypothetical protein